MKKSILLIILCLITSGTNMFSQDKKDKTDTKIEVIYFYGKQRCVTCNAIQKQTEELLSTHFKEEIDNGSITYRTIDISDKKNNNIVEKYEIYWSALLINKKQGKKEKVNNMTDFSFKYAHTNPDRFKDGIKEKINELLIK